MKIIKISNMRRVALMLLIFLSVKFVAQENLFMKVKERLKAEHPELKLDNKLIVINVWSAQDKQSRDLNGELNKAYTIYEYAKLKGGSRGMIGVMISTDEDFNLNEVALTKDNNSKNVAMVSNGLNVSGLKNIIYASDGSVIQKNIDSGLFQKVNQLITR